METKKSGVSVNFCHRHQGLMIQTGISETSDFRSEKMRFMVRRVQHSEIIRSTNRVYSSALSISRGKKATFSLYSISCLVFITETGSVYCAVRTGSLNITITFRP